MKTVQCDFCSNQIINIESGRDREFGKKQLESYYLIKNMAWSGDSEEAITTRIAVFTQRIL